MARKNSRKKEESLWREEVIAGYRKLAFGPGNDVLQLLFCDEQPCPETLASLDIFNVSDIKRPKGGGLEIRFYNRFEALARLVEVGGLSQVPDGVKSFYEAIERSVGE